jgi:hypothetical protein
MVQLTLNRVNQETTMTPNSNANPALRAVESQSLSHTGSYIHPSLNEAQSRGAEPAVLHFLGERMMTEFMFNCRVNGVDAQTLSTNDLKGGIDATLKGMVSPQREQFATTSFDSFRSLYKHTREDFKGIALKVAESHTERLIGTLQAVESSMLMRPAERAKIEGQIVRQAVVAGSCFRTAGRTPRHVVAMFRDNTDVAGSPLVALIEKAIDNESKVVNVRRANVARDQVKFIAPAPVNARAAQAVRA